jgi:hypothetical protein
MAENICHVPDLYVVDSEYRSMGGKLESHRNFLSEVVEDYLRITDWLCAHNEGVYINKLRNYRMKFTELPKRIVEIGGYWKWDCEQFVESIDAADEFLYEK